MLLIAKVSLSNSENVNNKLLEVLKKLGVVFTIEENVLSIDLKASIEITEDDENYASEILSIGASLALLEDALKRSERELQLIEGVFKVMEDARARKN